MICFAKKFSDNFSKMMQTFEADIVKMIKKHFEDLTFIASSEDKNDWRASF